MTGQVVVVQLLSWVGSDGVQAPAATATFRWLLVAQLVVVQPLLEVGPELEQL